LPAERLASFVAIGVPLFFCPMLIDPDYYWHLETGRLIVQNRALPTADPFSFMYEGQHWVLHEWLFQLVLYLAYAGLGDVGVRLLCAVTGAAFFGILFTTSWRLSGRAGVAMTLTLTSLLLLYPFIEPRPQIATLLLFALFLRALLFAKYLDDRRWFAAAPLMAAGSICMAATWWGCRRLGVRGWRARLMMRAETAMPVAQLRSSASSRFFACSELPQSRRAGAFALPDRQHGGDEGAAEWHPPTLDTLYGKSFLCAGLFALCLIYCRQRPDLTEIGPSGLMIAAGFASCVRALRPADDDRAGVMGAAACSW
jgi:hypothetical protein